MVYGVRPGATLLLNPSAQPPAQATFDPITRRAVRYIETVVPTVHQATAMSVPSDMIYQTAIDAGLTGGTGAGPAFKTSGTVDGWDATNKRSYLTLGNAGAGQLNMTSGPKLYYTGWPGNQSYAPKNSTVTQLTLEFTARFPTAADYTTNGIGMTDTPGALSFSNSSTYQWFQVYRDASTWIFATRDGSTRGASTYGTSDGSWHVFKVEWSSGSIVFYIDGTSAVTRTTNLPDKYLSFLACGTSGSSLTVDIVDYKISWS